MFGSASAAVSTVTNAPKNTGSGISTAVNDPYRVGRAGVTAGISEVMGAANKNAEKKREQAEQEMRDAQQQGYNTATDYLNQMSGTSTNAYKAQQGRIDSYLQNLQQHDDKANVADMTYRDGLNSAEDANRSRIEALMSQAKDQASNAQKTYTESIQPSFKNAMEKADQNASQAMSLKDAGDMNNPVQQGVRDFFNKQAAQQGRAGMADVGMLQSLGAQANAQQMGAGAPMTGAQMMMMQQGNAAQAGQAFANTQKRMQALRDQGIAQGIASSDAQYGRGQDAVRTAAAQREGFMGAEQNNMIMGQNTRGEQNQFGGQIKDATQNIAGNNYNADMSVNNRGLSNAGTRYNMVTGLENQRLSQQQMESQMGQNIAMGKVSDQMMNAYGQQAQANQQMMANNALLGSGITVLGAAAGGMAGGAAGAGAGATVGNSVGGAVTGQMNAQQSSPAMYQQYRPAQGVSYYNGGYG